MNSKMSILLQNSSNLVILKLSLVECESPSLKGAQRDCEFDMMGVPQVSNCKTASCRPSSYAMLQVKSPYCHFILSIFFRAHRNKPVKRLCHAATTMKPNGFLCRKMAKSSWIMEDSQGTHTQGPALRITGFSMSLYRVLKLFCDKHTQSLVLYRVEQKKWR